MVRKSKKKSKKRKADVLDKINAGDALAILRKLAKEDKDIARRIEKIAMEHLSEVDIESVASDVYLGLDCIAVEDLWDSSGGTSYGYVDPGDRAWEMFEETLEPYLEELRKYQKLSMHKEAKLYCMGILKGLYQFEEESETEFKSWAPDDPREFFKKVLRDWKKSSRNPDDIKKMEEFVINEFPGW